MQKGDVPRFRYVSLVLEISTFFIVLVAGIACLGGFLPIGGPSIFRGSDEPLTAENFEKILNRQLEYSFGYQYRPQISRVEDKIASLENALNRLEYQYPTVEGLVAWAEERQNALSGKTKVAVSPNTIGSGDVFSLKMGETTLLSEGTCMGGKITLPISVQSIGDRKAEITIGDSGSSGEQGVAAWHTPQTYTILDNVGTYINIDKWLQRADIDVLDIGKDRVILKAAFPPAC